MNSLQIKNSHQIECTKRVLGFFRFRKILEVKVNASEFESCSDMADVKSHLQLLGVNVARVHGYNFVRITNWQYIGRMILHIYLVDNGQEEFRVMQIMDICMKPKLTSLGLGSQLIRLITEIAKENSTKYIFGVLEAKGDLEARKRFFIRNDFQLIEDIEARRFGLSNICAIKSIAD